MKKAGSEVGRFSVRVQLANYVDMAASQYGALPPEKIRRCEVEALVDSGATHLVLTQELADQLGLEPVKEVTVTYADNRPGSRKLVRGVNLKYLDREDVFSAVVEPDSTSPIIGAIVMEALDLIIDCGKQELRPRDPERMTAALGAAIN